MELRINKAKVRIILGDITEQDVDAIAISANDRLWMGGRIAETIRKKGGDEIETEAMKQGQKKIGDVVVTSAGQLPFDKILHVVIMGQELKCTKESIALSTKNLLIKAEEINIESIAIPAFGTGVGKFPAHDAAQTMVESIIEFLLDSKKILEVKIVLRNEGLYKTYTAEFEKRFSKPRNQ